MFGFAYLVEYAIFPPPYFPLLRFHYTTIELAYQHFSSLLLTSSASGKNSRPGKIVPPVAELQGSLLGMEKTMPRM